MNVHIHSQFGKHVPILYVSVDKLVLLRYVANDFEICYIIWFKEV